MTETTKEKCKHDFRAVGNAGEGYYELCLRCNKTKPITKTTEEIIKKSVKEFNINYTSEYRWVKDRINKLSGSDFVEQLLIKAITNQRKSDLDKIIKHINGTWFADNLTPQETQSIIIEYLVALKERK